jgi:hypothetical protein
MLYILVTGANLRGLPDCVTSLPSWSCGFDSRRPLSTSITHIHRPIRCFLPPEDERFKATALGIADELNGRRVALRYRVEETDMISLFCMSGSCGPAYFS